MKFITNKKKIILEYYFSKLSFNPVVAGLTISLIIRMLIFESFGKAEKFCVSLAFSFFFLLVGILFVKRKKIFLFSLSLILGSASTLTTVYNPAWSGLSIDKVTQYSGYTSSDSRKLSSDKFMFEMELIEVGSKKEEYAEAGGKVIVFCKKDPNVYRGNFVKIASGLSAQKEYLSVMKNQRAGKYSFIKENVCFFSYSKKDNIQKLDWKNNIYKQRANLLKNISFRNKMLKSGSGGLFTALFIGNRDGLSLIENQVFRRSGCAHVLALSGMHLGILSGIILFLLKPLPGRKIGFFISCIIILFYLFLTDFGISLTRAALMYFIGGFAYSFYRKFRPIDVLFLSFICLVVINPSSFYTLSFQLTFSAVAGILIASPVFERLLRPYLPYWLSISLSCSLGAQLFVFPFLIHYFGEVFQVGIFSGLIIAPLVTIFIWIGIIHMITGFYFLSAVEGYLYKTIFFIAERLSVFPSIGKNMTLESSVIICCMFMLLLAGYSIYRSKIDGVSNKL